MDEHKKDPKARFAQKKLAEAIVKDIHSEKEMKVVETVTSVLFGGKDVKTLSTEQALSLEGSVPTSTDFNEDILELMIMTGAASSKREAREFISNGAVEINGVKAKDENQKVTKDAFDGKATIIKRGKKKFFLIKH